MIDFTRDPDVTALAWLLTSLEAYIYGRRYLVDKTSMFYVLYEAPPGAPGRPRKARFKSEALLSDLVYARRQ